MISLRQLYEHVKTLYEAQRYDDALSAIEAFKGEGGQLSDGLLVARGKLIQIADNSSLDLSEAERSFVEAIELNSRNVEAMAELGWFYLNVINNPRVALTWFARAEELLNMDMLSVRDGIKKCRFEL